MSEVANNELLTSLFCIGASSFLTFSPIKKLLPNIILNILNQMSQV